MARSGRRAVGSNRWGVSASTGGTLAPDGARGGAWFGMFAKAGTPQPIVDQLNAAIREVMLSPSLETYLSQRGAQPSKRTASEFKEFFHQEINLWRDVIVKANIEVE